MPCSDDKAQVRELCKRLRDDGFDPWLTDEQVLHFAVENGRILVTLDADFANVMRFPPEQTLGIVRLKVHPATEERIRQVIRRAVLFLQNIDIAGRLAVVDEDKIRIRG